MVVHTPGPLDPELGECPLHPGDAPGRGPGAQTISLGQQRVVVGRDPVARVARGCRPGRTGPPGGTNSVEQAGRRGRSRASGSSALIRHSMATPRGSHVRLAERERLAGGDPHLLADQVDAGDHLGDRVLDLDAAVDLHEVEVAVRRRPGTRRCRRRRSRRPRRRAPPRRPSARRAPAGSPGAGVSSISFWWRRCTEQSRSPRWTTLPWRSAQDLDLDVAGAVDVALDVDAAVAEERPAALRPGLAVGVGERRAGSRTTPHAPAAAAGHRLDDHRVADPSASRCGVRRRRQRLEAAGQQRQARPRPSARAAGALSPSAAITVGRRADERDAVRLADLGEVGVLGQEAVAGVDRVGAGALAPPR